MLSVVIDVHRNISSAQCYIRHDIKTTVVNSVQVCCTKNNLSISLLHNEECHQRVKILTADDFFIPASVSRVTNDFDRIEVEIDKFRISQKSNYSKYNNVIEQRLDALKLEGSDHIRDVYSPKMINKALENSNGIIPSHESGVDAESKEIIYSEHCLPVENVIEISFRIQISNCEEILKSPTDNLTPSSLYQFFKSEIHFGDWYDVVCNKCHSLVSTNPLSFESIKEYCHSSSDLSESWFCHKRVVPCSDLSSKILYVGDAYTYLHSSNFETFSLVGDCSEIKCKTCSSILTLGTISHNNRERLMCFYADMVMLKKSDSISTDYEKYQYKVTMLSLWTILNQKMMPVYRLFLQSKVKEREECLLIWVPSAKIAQFKLQAPAADIPLEVNFSTEVVYKVQYHFGNFSSPLVQKWKQDFDVHFYKVSKEFIKTLENLLKSSSKWLPGGRIVEDGFSNGCIPLNFVSLSNLS